MRMRSWLLALGFACTPELALAVPPIGSFELYFNGVMSIWTDDDDDETNEEEFCNGFAASFGDVESCEYDPDIDGKGKLSGQLAFVAWDDGTRIALTGTRRGAQRGDGRTGIATANLSWKLSGEVTDYIGPRKVKALLKYAGQVSPDGIVTGTWDERYCIEGGGCQSFQSDAPAETLDGDWLLLLEIVDTGGGTLGGSARTEFADGGWCNFSLSGKYNAKSDLASLSLTPINSGCAGTSIELKNVRTQLPIVYATPTDRQSLDPLYAFVCSGTQAIAASVDPSDCTWSIPAASAEPEIAIAVFDIKYKLFGFAASLTVVPFPGPFYGRAGFVYAPDGSAVVTGVSVESNEAALIEHAASATLGP